jgi:hypothetical protein
MLWSTLLRLDLYLWRQVESPAPVFGWRAGESDIGKISAASVE